MVQTESSEKPTLPPRSNAIPSGHDDEFKAQVVYSFKQGGTEFVFIKGDFAHTAEEAMSYLLEASMSMMENWLPSIYIERDGRGRAFKSNATVGGDWFGAVR